MRRLKSWLGALLALVVLSTATLHILSHADLTESSCVVCHMQEASVPAAPAPAVVAVEAPSTAVDAAPAPEASQSAVVAASARAPPSVLS